jgi:hypothetical protein
MLDVTAQRSSKLGFPRPKTEINSNLINLRPRLSEFSLHISAYPNWLCAVDFVETTVKHNRDSLNGTRFDNSYGEPLCGMQSYGY